MNKSTIEETIVKNVKLFNKNLKEGRIKNLTVSAKFSKPQSKRSKSKEYCPYCNSETILLWVHSHYQCQKCKNIVVGCCGDK